MAGTRTSARARDNLFPKVEAPISSSPSTSCIRTVFGGLLDWIDTVPIVGLSSIRLYYWCVPDQRLPLPLYLNHRFRVLGICGVFYTCFDHLVCKASVQFQAGPYVPVLIHGAGLGVRGSRMATDSR